MNISSNKHEKDRGILGMINKKDIWNNTILVSLLLTWNKFGILLVFTTEFEHELAQTDVLKNFKKLTKKCFSKSHFSIKLHLYLVAASRVKGSQVFSCGFCKVFPNSYLTDCLRVTASESNILYCTAPASALHLLLTFLFCLDTSKRGCGNVWF